MMKAKQKRRNKTPGETFTTSPAMIVMVNAIVRETVNAPQKQSQRGCRSIQEDETRKIW